MGGGGGGTSSTGLYRPMVGEKVKRDAGETAPQPSLLPSPGGSDDVAPTATTAESLGLEVQMQTSASAPASVHV